MPVTIPDRWAWKPPGLARWGGFRVGPAVTFAIRSQGRGERVSRQRRQAARSVRFAPLLFIRACTPAQKGRSNPQKQTVAHPALLSPTVRVCFGMRPTRRARISFPHTQG